MTETFEERAKRLELSDQWVDVAGSIGYAAWIEGFQIFKKYEPDAKFPICAEHDAVYAMAGEAFRDAVGDGDLVRLSQLGWTWDVDVGSFRKFV